MARKYGLLTEHQIRVLKLRSKGLSLREVASILGVSHQNISLTEKRALENIETAKQTLIAYKLATSPIKIIINEGTKLIEIPRIIVEEADKAEIKVKGDFTLIFKLIRFKARECLKDNRIKKPILVAIDNQGEVDVYPYHVVQQLYEDIERL